jgi:hypothetical protein
MTFSFGKWLRAMNRSAANRAATRRGANRTRHHRSGPRLEALEDRCLLSGGISLAPSEPGPQLVGEPITWTATVAGPAPGLVYQFSAGSPGGPFRMVRDFSPDDSFTWTPMQEGTYRIRVAVKDGFNASDAESAVVTDKVDSRVTGDQPVVSSTANPLVALFSAPPGPEGTVHVEFAVAGDNPSWQSTNVLPSLPSRSTNFFVAGMLPNTTYEMRDVFSDGTTSAPLLFTTGTIPSTVKPPPISVPQPPGPGSDLDQGLIFQETGKSTQIQPYVTDLAGHVVWYYDLAQAGLKAGIPATGADLVPGGTVLLTGADSRATIPYSQDVLREIDLAGDTVRETNVDAINAQLTTMGHEVISSLTHDVTRLPSGQTAVIGLTERTVNINGTPTNYVGADVIVLDQNFQVAWVWDSFDHLDINRGPVLGETVQPGVLDPNAAVPDLPAVDWLHANSVDWSPADGNLTLSLRNQDWVIKIDYANETGDGHVIWRLGQGGDFTVQEGGTPRGFPLTPPPVSTDSSPWFSHQHDAHYINDSTMIVFDNGDTRRASDPTADSRGQVWKIDESTMTATLVFNADLGNYSDALGSAQRLSNGNYSFDSGRQGLPPYIGQSIEVRPDGSKAYVLQTNVSLYRAFRIGSLYEGISDQLTVTSAADSGPGSLRSEIALAQSGDTITFDPGLAGQTITLTSGELAITKSLDIEGPGADQLTISGDNASRVFDINSGATVTIAGMTITDGLANGSSPVLASTGGAILNFGSLTLSDDVLTNNRAIGDPGTSPTGRPGGALGGGVANLGKGDLTISGSAFTGNRALGADGSSGTSAGNAQGGAITNFATASVTDSQFTFNVARAGSDESGSLDATGTGGGIHNLGSLTITGSTFSQNRAIGGNDSTGAARPGLGAGGAIVSGGPAGPATLVISASTFDHNQAIGGNGNQGGGSTGPNDAFGGAIHLAGGTAAISGCTLEHNAAIAGAGGAGQDGGLAFGGALDADNAFGHAFSATVSNCSIEHNAAIGGAGGLGGNGGDGWGGGLADVLGATLTVSDSTVGHNRAIGGAGGAGGNGGNGLGGGIYEDASSTLTLTSARVEHNRAVGGAESHVGSDGAGVGGGLYLAPGGRAAADALTILFGNDASTSADDVFGALGEL